MDWISRIGTLIPASYQIKLKHRLGVPNMVWSLSNLAKCGFRPTVIWDVGAYEGEWSLLAKGIFPRARIWMFEPQQSKRTILERLSSASPQQLSYIRALCGAEAKEEVAFYQNETVSSVLTEWEKPSGAYEAMAMTTLDLLCNGSRVDLPDLIKLDVQGYELEVLKGASHVMDVHPPEVLVLEVSLIDINKGAPLWSEVDRWLSNLGYRLYDICTLMRRPSDNALWQVDGIYCHKSSPLLVSKRW